MGLLDKLLGKRGKEGKDGLTKEQRASIERMKRLRASLYEEPPTVPLVEISGVVNARGLSSAHSRGDDYWTQGFTLPAWRVNGGAVRTDDLRLESRAPESDLDYLHSVIKADTVVRIRARLADDGSGPPLARIEEFIGLEEGDAELDARLAEFTTPTTFDDEQFGTFTFDRSVSWYEASVVWAGSQAKLNLSIEDADEVQECLDIARSLWSEESSWDTRIKDRTIADLLPLKNDAWLDEDESEVSKRQFLERLQLESITVRPGGEFEFFYLDGDLFFGHVIIVTGSLAAGPREASIAG